MLVPSGFSSLSSSSLSVFHSSTITKNRKCNIISSFSKIDKNVGSFGNASNVATSLAASILDGVATNNHIDGGWKTILLTTLIRGGELFARQHTEHLDINRVRMRLEGLQAYGTLCALLANGCLRLYSSVSAPSKKREDSIDIDRKNISGGIDGNDNENNNNTKGNIFSSTKRLRKRLAYDGFFLCCVLSILSGSYTTVIFTLLPLYSKMALGRGYDLQFLQFWASTAHIRQTGFTAFLFSLVSFEVAFVLSLYIRTRGQRKRMLVTIATIICMLSFWEWTKVMQLAEKYLFTLKAEVEY